MSQNLLDKIKTHFAGETVSQVSVAVGENEAAVSKVLTRVIPIVLDSFIELADQPGGTEVLWGMTREASESGILTNLTRSVSSGGGWLNRGVELTKSLLDERYTTTVESISRTSGAHATAVSSLFGMAAPVTLGVLGQYSAEHGFDAGDLARWLQTQKNTVVGAMKPEVGGGSIAPWTKIGGPSEAVPLNSYELDARPSHSGGHLYAHQETVAQGKGPMRWILLGLLLVAIAALVEVGFFLGQRRGGVDANGLGGDTASATSATDKGGNSAVAAPLAGRYDKASGNFIYDTGAPTLLKLADGSRLMAGTNSTESRLYQFLADDNIQVDSVNRTKGWISFDRVYFEPNSSKITGESQQQLQNIARILKSFPNAKVKIGGYTDNHGEFKLNLKLSEARATAAMAELVDLGIDATRIVAKGYGQKIPIASNDTDDGRALNRRISIRVTQK
ncbi:OmpA family protein [Hymenobacter sp. BT491]|uniref:OmpA family protein n=1 Tax=Hymenobacter sp. BT491 TaxID=2766779 RepID=UPI0016539A14|nr:OmpA family protein [Hymenobacter sp. BT491]MBC6988044.1 OmpA family protein [Hymenobacter sp. BT491]